MKVTVGTQSFRGSAAPTKKDAKLKAAEVALIALRNSNIPKPPSLIGPERTNVVCR